VNARRPTQLPGPTAGRGARGHLATAGALVLAAVVAGVASGARPFTEPADVAISIPSALLVGSVFAAWRWPQSGPWRRMDPSRPADGKGTAIPWLVVIALVVAVELASYFHSGPRADYPTISSGIDGLFRYRAAKAAGWFVWLAVGSFLARR
jgi:hypothetical protein